MKATTRTPRGSFAAFVLGALALSAAAAAGVESEMPHGWLLAGSHSNDFRVGVDRTIRHGGPASAHLAATKPSDGFGTLMQSFDAEAHRGKRLRLAAWIKADLEDSQWAGLWMRIDGPGPGIDMLAFDNMAERPIVGKSDWQRYQVVLDVPPEAVRIAFGVLAVHGGQVWVDEMSLGEVGPHVPTTASGALDRLEPINLDFEEGGP